MPFTLSGRALWYIFLLVLVAACIGVVVVALVNLIYWMTGHRRFVPWAHLLRFKFDDMKQTSKKVDEILETGHGKKSKKQKT